MIFIFCALDKEWIIWYRFKWFKVPIHGSNWLCKAI